MCRARKSEVAAELNACREHNACRERPLGALPAMALPAITPLGLGRLLEHKGFGAVFTLKLGKIG